MYTWAYSAYEGRTSTVHMKTEERPVATSSFKWNRAPPFEYLLMLLHFTFIIYFTNKINSVKTEFCVLPKQYQIIFI